MKVNISGIWYDSEKTPIQIRLSKLDKNNISNMQEDKFNYICFPKGMKWEDVEKKLSIKKGAEVIKKRKIRELINEALITDGAHHKQWYIKKIAQELGVSFKDNDDDCVAH